MSGHCTTPGCDGDRNYAAPGRGHISGCRYPAPVQGSDELQAALHRAIQEASWDTGGTMPDSDVAVFRKRILALPAVQRLLAAEAAVERVRDLIKGDIDTPHECTPLVSPVEIADALDDQP